MGNAVSVADDQRRAVVSFGFVEGLDSLGGVGAQRDRGYVNVAVGHGDHAEIFLRHSLAAGREEGLGAKRGSLGHLATGVGINFRVEDQDVDVLAGGDDVVESAVADVVSPAVAAKDPDGLLDEVVCEGVELLGFLLVAFSKALFEFSDSGALLFDLSLVGLRSVLDSFKKRLALGAAFAGEELVDQFEGEAFELVDAQAHAETELSVVFEEGVGPGRAAAVGALTVRGGRQVAAVNGGAARRVGDHGSVAEELTQEFHIRSLAAAGAGAGILKERAAELAALDGGRVGQFGFRFGEVEEEGVVLGFGFSQRLLLLHIDGFLAFLGLRLGGAHFDAGAAASAVFRSDLDRELQAGESGRLGVS